MTERELLESMRSSLHSIDVRLSRMETTLEVRMPALDEQLDRHSNRIRGIEKNVGSLQLSRAKVAGATAPPACR